MNGNIHTVNELSRARLALARIGDRRAVGPIYGVLTDENAQVRCAARFYLREAFGVDLITDLVDEADEETLP